MRAIAAPRRLGHPGHVSPDVLDWSKVTAAYGPAVQVPELLRHLYSQDQALRQQAVADLWSALCHQETVYEASAVAVPFLFEAAREAPFTPSERHEVLGLLAAIGRGEDTCWEGYTSWAVVQECVRAVETLLPSLFDWAVTGDPEARRWAVVLATYFPAKSRALGQDAITFLSVPDPSLSRLIRLLLDGVEGQNLRYVVVPCQSPSGCHGCSLADVEHDRDGKGRDAYPLWSAGSCDGLVVRAWRD